MYSLKTYFFWFLVLYIRVARAFEYGLLRLLRSPINRFITRRAASGGIIINDENTDLDVSLKPEYGDEPLIHIRVRNPSTFIRIINGGATGLAESYMERWWDCDQLEELTIRIAELAEGLRPHPLLKLMDWITLNSDDKPWESLDGSDSGGWVSEMGDEFFGAMLGPNKLYMCGSWKTAQTVEEAQADNMKLLGQKLDLQPGMRLLDLGCGYGALTRYLADKFNVEAIGCTYSAEEAAKAREYARASKNVKIQECDYKVLSGKFDRIVCVQMLEHLGGPRHYAAFFEKMDSLLAPDGLLVLQTNVIPNVPPIRTDQFGRKYFMRNSVAAHTLEILNAAESAFLVEDLQNIGAHWEKSVVASLANLEQGWKETLSQKYDIKYYRMVQLYLKVYIGAIKARKVQMWQVVFSKKSSVRSYESVR